MGLKQKILNRIPKKYKLEILFENLNKDKLYAKSYFARKLGTNVHYLRNLYDMFSNRKELDRIEIQHKTFWGFKETVKKIKEMLVE